MAEEIRQAHSVCFTSLEEVIQGATFIIEVIPENIEMKRELYKEIEKYVVKKLFLRVIHLDLRQLL